MCTGMTARVEGVIAAASAAASMLSDSSISTNSGTAPRITTALIVAIQVYVGTATSSPGPMPSAASAVIKAPVPDVTARA